MIRLRIFLRRHRRGLVELVYAAIVTMALVAGFGLRFEFSVDAPYPRLLAEALPLVVATKLLVFRGFSLRDLAWRYLGFADLLRICAASLAASAASFLVLTLAAGDSFPRSIHIIDLLAATALLVSVHGAVRMFFDARNARAGTFRRVAIYGAGRAGVRLLGEIRADPKMGLAVHGFFDDDALKLGLRVQGVKVLGGLAELPGGARKRRIEMVLIALPTDAGDRIAAILAACQRARVAAKRVPARAGFIPGRTLAEEIRDVRIEDLLGRRPVELANGRLHSRLEGRAVLVTGAGGSIGSELCRQIARLRPSLLIGLDHAETPLYEIDREIRERFPDVAFRPELGSIQNPRRLEEIFGRYSPQSVYHAAAYKHVPLMETHLFEAVENNVFGTRNVAHGAAAAGVGDFVLISSDKAVRPSSVMGATKRLAEMVVQRESAKRAGGTRFLAVRFGNVLGSSGSVIPLFKQQIAAGGPLTVTHPEMRRFFMTVSEAAQLVLEAAAMGRGGEIFALEMGEPVYIAELARKMILLSGLRPEDIAIHFCGIRPGEKLCEELGASEPGAYGDDTLPTRHSRIRVFTGAEPWPDTLARGLETLRSAIQHGDAAGALMCLRELVPDFNPSDDLGRRSSRERARGVFA